jgi:hypothetical protein
MGRRREHREVRAERTKRERKKTVVAFVAPTEKGRTSRTTVLEQKAMEGVDDGARFDGHKLD